MTQTQNQALPRQFGKYVLVRKIAMGGMAEVFKAKTAGAEGFEKDVVIKRILPHFTEDESFVKMFIDEASITSKLQHANIVQIFDFDVCEGSYYIAMEIVEGEDLKKVIDLGIKRGKPLSIAQTVWIMMELSKGLHYAHTKEHKGQPLNIVHRDISPHNAMVSYSGEVKLMDFGIAKAAQRSTKTMAGTVKGKVAYMSPEQARGKNLDGRSDLFALGIMLWEMLTGKRLFLGDSDFETLTNVLKNDAPPPSTLNPKVPKDLDEIVLKALKKDRDERYASVEAFARDLTRWYYSNVTDLEAESLKKFMSDTFAEEIARLKQLSDEEKSLPAPSGGSLAQSERTVAMPADGSMPPPAEFSQQRGRAGTQSGMQAAGAGTGSYAQQPQMTAMTGAYGTGVQPVPQKSKAWLWILLVLLLGGGGAAVAIIMGGSKGTEEVAAWPRPTRRWRLRPRTRRSCS
ncbi:MAG: protein kinase [Myxococcota bacterium]